MRVSEGPLASPLSRQIELDYKNVDGIPFL
jgi:hypothetical protein